MATMTMVMAMMVEMTLVLQTMVAMTLVMTIMSVVTILGGVGVCVGVCFIKCTEIDDFGNGNNDVNDFNDCGDGGDDPLFMVMTMVMGIITMMMVGMSR